MYDPTFQCGQLFVTKDENMILDHACCHGLTSIQYLAPKIWQQLGTENIKTCGFIDVLPGYKKYTQLKQDSFDRHVLRGCRIRSFIYLLICLFHLRCEFFVV